MPEDVWPATCRGDLVGIDHQHFWDRGCVTGNSEVISPKRENGRSRLVSQKSPAVMLLAFYAYSARLLLLASSCASSDSAFLPLR